MSREVKTNQERQKLHSHAHTISKLVYHEKKDTCTI